MIYRCPNCGNVLEYDVSSGLLRCSYCGTSYEVKDAAASQEEMQEISAKAGQETKSIFDDNLSEDDLMEMKIYHCSSCGADIMVSDTEVSTFCSFCGFPTIIFDRISKEKKPNKILPFKLSKQEALARIKEKFENNSFVSDEIKTISVNEIYGIYIPYWLYMTEIERNFTKKINRNSQFEEEVYIQGKENLSVLLDASKNIPDGLSMRLEPFPLSELVDFNPAYLSGFHAEKYDVQANERSDEAHSMVRKIMDYKLLTNYYKKNNMDYSFLATMDDYACGGSENYKTKLIMSSLLPIYFVTIRHEHRFILILVNGVTGKVVTNLPVDEEKLKKKKIQNSILATVLYSIVFVVFASLAPKYYGLWILMVFPIFVLRIAVDNGIKARAQYKKAGAAVVEAQDRMMSRKGRMR